jgi:hypothetical protein
MMGLALLHDTLPACSVFTPRMVPRVSWCVFYSFVLCSTVSVGRGSSSVGQTEGRDAQVILPTSPDSPGSRLLDGTEYDHHRILSIMRPNDDVVWSLEFASLGYEDDPDFPFRLLSPMF